VLVCLQRHEDAAQHARDVGESVGMNGRSGPSPNADANRPPMNPRVLRVCNAALGSPVVPEVNAPCSPDRVRVGRGTLRLAALEFVAEAQLPRLRGTEHHLVRQPRQARAELREQSRVGNAVVLIGRDAHLRAERAATPRRTAFRGLRDGPYVIEATWCRASTRTHALAVCVMRRRGGVCGVALCGLPAGRRARRRT
jgi:hypothetical protein